MYEDLPFDADLMAQLEALQPTVTAGAGNRINFYVPTFKQFETSEVSSCGKNDFPGISITGGDCDLQCDHCKAKILAPMIPARTPEALWHEATKAAGQGANGLLISGGSNVRNEVPFAPFFPTMSRIREELGLKLAVHTGLVDEEQAAGFAQAKVDVAMLDIIGAQETITEVYHLKRPVEEFELSLKRLNEAGLKTVPHIVIGLHYGKFLGEYKALEMIARQKPSALVLVVVMPFYAPANKIFMTPNVHQIGRFFMACRKALPDIPILLGCARPPGEHRLMTDAYAMLSGLNGIAFPSEGLVGIAAQLGRQVGVHPSCCSMAVDPQLFEGKEEVAA